LDYRGNPTMPTNFIFEAQYCSRSTDLFFAAGFIVAYSMKQKLDHAKNDAVDTDRAITCKAKSYMNATASSLLLFLEDVRLA